MKDSLFALSTERPDHTAIISGDDRISYGLLAEKILSAAGNIEALGVEKGDRVLLSCPNGSDFVAGYFAIHSLGAIAVPVDFGACDSDLKQVIDDAKPALSIVEESRRLPVKAVRVDDITAVSGNVPHKRRNVMLDDPADLMYTTGTTGRRKGVLLTHGQIAAAARNIATFVRSCATDLEVVPIPLTHSFGLGRLRCMAVVGNAVALEPGLRNPAVLLKRILDLQASGLALVPTGFELMLRLTRDKLGDARDHLRYVEIGSAPIRRETEKRLVQLLPKTRICHHYGLTEASRSCFREFHSDSHKPDSVGRPSPNVKVAVFDETGAPLPPMQEGELVVFGEMTMKEYWNRPELNSTAFLDGGLKTGDVGYVDSDGYVYLMGRRGDIINVGGLKVAPSEVESSMLLHKKIADCACAGFPDDITGEKIRLFYVAGEELDPTELVNSLRGLLEEYKIPKEFQRVTEIPKTTTGKIQRNRLPALVGWKAT